MRKVVLLLMATACSCAFGQQNGQITLSSDNVTLTVTETLRITAQPLPRSVDEGEDTVFYLRATGGTAPISAEWYKDGLLATNGTANVESDNYFSYTILGVQTADAGEYFAVIQDSHLTFPQSVNSNLAILVFRPAGTPDPEWELMYPGANQIFSRMDAHLMVLHSLAQSPGVIPDNVNLDNVSSQGVDFILNVGEHRFVEDPGTPLQDVPLDGWSTQVVLNGANAVDGDGGPWPFTIDNTLQCLISPYLVVDGIKVRMSNTVITVTLNGNPLPTSGLYWILDLAP